MNAKSDRSGNWHKHLLELKTSWSSLGNNDETFQPQSVMAPPRLTRWRSWSRLWPVSPSWPPPRPWPSTPCWWLSPWPGRGGGGGTWTLWSGARRASAQSSRRRSTRCRSGAPWHSVKAALSNAGYLQVLEKFMSSIPENTNYQQQVRHGRLWPWENCVIGFMLGWGCTPQIHCIYGPVKVAFIEHPPPSSSRTGRSQCHGWEALSLGVQGPGTLSGEIIFWIRWNPIVIIDFNQKLSNHLITAEVGCFHF